METPILKSVSNVKLLDMYYEYQVAVHRYKSILDNKSRVIDKETREWYYDKFIRDGEYLAQIKLEILSRMMGMEID